MAVLVETCSLLTHGRVSNLPPHVHDVLARSSVLYGVLWNASNLLSIHAYNHNNPELQELLS